MKRSVAKHLALVFYALIILGVAFSIRSRMIQADSSLKLSDKDVLSIEIDGDMIQFVQEKYQDGSSFKHYLTKRNFWTIEAKVELEGFETDVRLCDKHTYDFGTDSVICFIGDVGAHSQNLEFVQYSGGKLEPVKFVDGSGEKNNTTSDWPSFETGNYNEDGFLDILALDRDYDKNPLVDSIKREYLGSSRGFVLTER